MFSYVFFRRMLRKSLSNKVRRYLVILLGGTWDWDSWMQIDTEEAETLLRNAYRREKQKGYSVSEHRDRMSKLHKAITLPIKTWHY